MSVYRYLLIAVTSLNLTLQQSHSHAETIEGVAVDDVNSNITITGLTIYEEGKCSNTYGQVVLQNHTSNITYAVAICRREVGVGKIVRSFEYHTISPGTKMPIGCTKEHAYSDNSFYLAWQWPTFGYLPKHLNDPKKALVIKKSGSNYGFISNGHGGKTIKIRYKLGSSDNKERLGPHDAAPIHFPSFSIKSVRYLEPYIGTHCYAFPDKYPSDHILRRNLRDAPR